MNDSTNFLTDSPVFAGAIVAFIGTLITQIIILFKIILEVKNNKSNLIKSEVVDKQFESIISFYSSCYEYLNLKNDFDVNIIAQGQIYTNCLKLDAIYNRNWQNKYSKLIEHVKNRKKGVLVDNSILKQIELEIKELIWFQQKLLRNPNGGFIFITYLKISSKCKFK